MAVLSGKNGTLNLGGFQVAPVSNWRLAVTSNNPNYAANDTGGWKQRAAGVRDSSGSFEVKVNDGGHCPVAEGDSAALELHIDGSGNNYYAVAAIIDTDRSQRGHQRRQDCRLPHRRSPATAR